MGAVNSGPASATVQTVGSGSAPDAATLLEQAGQGSVRALARLLTWVEVGGPRAAPISAALAGRPRPARIWGLTGPPGVGKSTLTSALISDARAAGQRVAVLAVDPSSPFSGGALLGDRVRMGDHVTDPGVFIRSMASRGHLGGLSSATPAAVDLMSALGFDVVLVETVGVGQNEVDVLRLADTVVVVTAPGAGDGIQAAKAGILEIADVLVVNKGDREGAASTVRELKAMLAIGRSEAGPTSAPPGRPETPAVPRWRVPVLTTTATTGAGLPELVDQIRSHGNFAERTSLAAERRLARSAITVQTLLTDHVQRLTASPAGRAVLDRVAGELAQRAGDPSEGAAALWNWVRAQPYH